MSVAATAACPTLQGGVGMTAGSRGLRRCRVKADGSDIRRVTEYQPWSWHQLYQHLYLGVLYGLLALKSVFIDDFSALAEGKIGSVTLAKQTPFESAAFWGSKAFYAAVYLVAPFRWGQHGPLQTLGLYLLAEMVTGWFLAFMFQVAHVVPDVDYLRRDSHGRVRMGWAAAQCATTADFCHGSWFWTHISGGLNHQVVHHLFPGVCHVHYPALAPIVMKTCKASAPGVLNPRGRGEQQLHATDLHPRPM